MKYFYTYYSYEEWGRGYIGKRECKCLPDQDVKYFGSFRDKSFTPSCKIILGVHETREDALESEVALHCFFKVDINPHFVNRAKQTSKKFFYDATGKRHSPAALEKMRGHKRTEAHREAISEANRRRIHTPEMKERNRQAQLKLNKKHSPETIEILRERMLSNNPFKGRNHTEETKKILREQKLGKPSPIKGVPKPPGFSEKIREIVSGRRWFVNKEGETKQCIKNPGLGWQPGRKFTPP